MAIGGNGIPLPYPQASVPPLPFNFSNFFGSQAFTLVAGGCVLVPPGMWNIYLGSYSWLQWQSPITGEWHPLASNTRTNFVQVSSDGANYRIWNPKGFPVSATVGAAGNGYVQASTTVTAGSGGSLWHAIVGGALGTVVIGADTKGNVGGTNFTIPPTIVVPAPPSSITGLPSTATVLGGIPALATCTISNGAINAVTITSTAAGAGYQGTQTLQVIPNPFDPNIGTITVPTLTVPVTGAGTITAVVMDYFGTTSGSAPTLTIAGAGSSGTATANIVATAATDNIIIQAVPSGI